MITSNLLTAGCLAAQSLRSTVLRTAMIIAMTAALSGCLGGGSDDEPKDSIGPNAVPPVTQPPAKVNRAPEVSGVPAATAKVGTAYSFVPTATDADNDFLEFSVTNKPTWAVFSDETGALTGTPAAGNVGQSDDISIAVTDGTEQRVIGPFRITVDAADKPVSASNAAPTISGTAPGAIDVGAAYNFRPAAADADGDALTFSVSNRPSWASFSTSTGALTGTPAITNVASYANIVISVNDGKVTTSLAAFAIQVKGPNNMPPVVSGSPMTAIKAAQAYSFQPSATDANGDKLTWTIANKPAWATFSTTTGRLSGTPVKANVGSFAGIAIAASDGKASAALPTFAIAVTTDNSAPTITGTPAKTAKVGVDYSFTPTGKDVDNDALGYTISNRPAWATFDTATGRLSGKPTAAGSFSNIVIGVSDSKTSASLAAFTITVSAAANTAPTISGTPATTASVGAAYLFKPTATDADAGTTLSFSIANKPSWATFSTTTGQLSGSPAAAATHSNIVITVSDGTVSASLAAFSITVSASTASGSAQLNWQAPTENTDGTTLNNLAGFRIVYGTSSQTLTQTVELTNPGLTTYTVNELGAGTWYFAVKAYTADGAESALSNIASKTIQ
jgi:hypothetical protein